MRHLICLYLGFFWALNAIKWCFRTWKCWDRRFDFQLCFPKWEDFTEKFTLNRGLWFRHERFLLCFGLCCSWLFGFRLSFGLGLRRSLGRLCCCGFGCFGLLFESRCLWLDRRRKIGLGFERFLGYLGLLFGLILCLWLLLGLYFGILWCFEVRGWRTGLCGGLRLDLLIRFGWRWGFGGLCFLNSLWEIHRNLRLLCCFLLLCLRILCGWLHLPLNLLLGIRLYFIRKNNL